MTSLRLELRKFTWIAMFAMLGLVLAPTLSHALAFVKGDNSALAEICTPLGTQVLVLEDTAGDANAPSPGAPHFDHCPYCTQGPTALGLPPPPVSLIAAFLAGIEVPLAFLRAPKTQFTWAAAQPRAPPASS